MNALRYSLPDIIRQRRKQLRITRPRLSRMTGISRYTIETIERREYPASLENAERLLNALGLALTITERGSECTK